MKIRCYEDKGVWSVVISGSDGKDGIYQLNGTELHKVSPLGYYRERVPKELRQAVYALMVL